MLFLRKGIDQNIEWCAVVDIDTAHHGNGTDDEIVKKCDDTPRKIIFLFCSHILQRQTKREAERI